MEEHIAKPVVEKHVIKGKVQNWDHKIFTVQGVADSEQLVVVQFSRSVKYRVVKLDVNDLPPQDADGNTIHWVNNFAVVGTSGRPVKKVQYTLFLFEPPVRYTPCVYYADGKLRRDKKPRRKGSKPEQSGMLQVDFTTGDPGIGWT